MTRITYPPVAEGVILVDLDGSILPWGDLYGMPEPLSGVRTAMREMKEAGYTIGIFTSRLSSKWHRAEGWKTRAARKEQREYIASVLEKYGIPFDFMTSEKVPSVLILDDKAMRLNRQRGMLQAWRAFQSFGDAAI